MGTFSDYGRAAADLSQQEANRRALAVQQRGQLWGGTIASLSQLPLQIRQQQDQEKRTAIADRRATQEGALTDIRLDQARREIVQDDQIKKILATSTPYEAVTKLRAIDPERAAKLEKANAEYVVDTIRRVPPGTPGSAIAPKLQPFMSSDEIKLLPETIDAPFQRQTVMNYLEPKTWLEANTPKPLGTRLIETPAGQQIVPDVPGTYPAKPTEAKKPTPGSFEDFMAATPDQRAKILSDRKAYGQADDRPSVAVSLAGDEKQDIKDYVRGVMSGDIPPEIIGRASRDYAAIMAEFTRQGFDLSSAVTDWRATQKHVSTLNGAQQTRLGQAIGALPELLDSVEGIAKQWKGGRFPPLNKANLVAAKNGVYGPEVASVANQLSTQIADVVGDLGTVYMGGNSPTDHALQLAETALKGEWDEKVILDMINLARKNVQIRKNSIKNFGVQGASADNPYAAPPVAPMVEEWERGPDGTLRKKGTP